MMNGRIWVESEQHEGSTFHFTARLAVSAASRNYAAKAASAARSVKGVKALVVDDNRTNRDIITLTLQNWGVQVLAVETDLAIGAHHAADGAQRRGLAGAVRAENGGDRAFVQGEIHAVERLGLTVVGLESLDLEQRHQADVPK